MGVFKFVTLIWLYNSNYYYPWLQSIMNFQLICLIFDYLKLFYSFKLQGKVLIIYKNKYFFVHVKFKILK